MNTLLLFASKVARFRPSLRARRFRSENRFRYSAAVFIAALACVTAPARAQVVYNEAVSGDFSNSGLSPTHVNVSWGSNKIMGTTGRGPTGVDRDYLTFTIAPGFALTGLYELAGTTVGGSLSFIGLEWGPKLTLPTNPATAAGLLGWAHYGATSSDLDLLPLMAASGDGASGFMSPLGPGDYSLWIQDFNVGPIRYGFDLRVSAVPEPSTYALFGCALLGAAARWRRRSRAIA